MRRLPQKVEDIELTRFYAKSALLLARWINVSEARKLLRSREAKEALAAAEADLVLDTSSLLETSAS